MEIKYQLQQVLSPKKYLPKALRQLPRFDTRKEVMRKDIAAVILIAKNYADFETKMKQKGYAVLKGRGIAFTDTKGVKVKGSELGYSLQTIEKMLLVKPELRSMMIQQKEGRRKDEWMQYNANKKEPIFTGNQEQLQHNFTAEEHKQAAQNLVEQLMKPHEQRESYAHLIAAKEKKEKKEGIASLKE